ncbi:MAG: hypothetical protein IIA10_04390 [Proteobacteria bacterium]|nr:hypothetical protein [Pseudomonadota bacterium]
MSRAVHYHSDEGVHCAVLGRPGRKFTPMVLIDYPVRLRKIPNAEAVRYSRDIDGTTVQTVAQKMLAAGERMGINKSARKLLNEITTTNGEMT